MTIKEHKIGNITGKILIPDEGKIIKNIKTGRIYKNKVFVIDEIESYIEMEN